MTFLEQFEALKKKLDKLNTETLPTDLAIQINMTDEDCGGAFYIANIGGNFAVEPYDYHDHTAMLTATAHTFKKILSGSLDATDAYFRGLLAIEGSIDHAQALASLTKKVEKKTTTKKVVSSKKPATKKVAPVAAKKAPAKKPAAKKPAAKKPAAKKTAAKKTTKK